MTADLKATLVYISPLLALAAVLVMGTYVVALGTLLVYLTLVVWAAFLVMFLRGRPWRPAVFLLAVVPFQGVLIRNFGLAGHAGMVLAVAVFLLSDSSRSWADRLLGTTTQKLTALFVVALALSVFLAGFDQVILLRYGQVVMLLFTVAIFVQGFGGGDHIRKLAWAAAGSAALLFILSILDFYLGLRVLPMEGSRSFETGLLEEIDRGLIAGFRLAGPEQTYGANRFAFYGILPISLLVGLLLTERHGWRAGLAVASLLIFGFGILASGSLSGIDLPPIVVPQVMRHW